MDKDILKVLGGISAGGISAYIGGNVTTGIGDGNFSEGLVTISSMSGMTYGISGGSTEDTSAPDFIIRTEDNNNYSKVEIRAQEIYDKFHKEHYKEDKLSVLIADTPEKTEALEELLEMFDSKEELYIYLTALQRAVEEIIEEEQKQDKGNTKKLERK